MIVLYSLFEAPNVFNNHPSGLIAPFGIVNNSDKNKLILKKSQNMSMKDLDEQVKIKNKLLGE